MGLNTARYRTFADDIQARKVARAIERNLMGIKPNQGGRKQMNVSGNQNPKAPLPKERKQPLNPNVDEKKLKNKIATSGRGVGQSKRTKWTRNRKKP